MPLVADGHFLVVNLIDVAHVGELFEDQDFVVVKNLVGDQVLYVRAVAVEHETHPPIRVVLDDGHVADCLRKGLCEFDPRLVRHERSRGHDDGRTLLRAVPLQKAVGEALALLLAREEEGSRPGGLR